MLLLASPTQSSDHPFESAPLAQASTAFLSAIRISSQDLLSFSSPPLGVYYSPIYALNLQPSRFQSDLFFKPLFFCDGFFWFSPFLI
jgi:hypothetical protein